MRRERESDRQTDRKTRRRHTDLDGIVFSGEVGKSVNQIVEGAVFSSGLDNRGLAVTVLLGFVGHRVVIIFG